MVELARGDRVRITRTTPYGTSVRTGQIVSDITHGGFIFAEDGAGTGAMVTDETFAEYLRTTWKVAGSQVTEVIT
ncbi:hypothetical protein [Nocardiopsis sp. JB363]|uniref:hypothetical protein n=1 Tax=Nocardiopsis sp. JB363 TaxID=1434837 RepID=UPI00097B06C9|nr:hypothetical protein [Nocardiopsis sp. JB363]SIO89642.1 hypothetical protein BQ8420_22635 [Nocardiopsis sp. JB363]